MPMGSTPAILSLHSGWGLMLIRCVYQSWHSLPPQLHCIEIRSLSTGEHRIRQLLRTKKCRSTFLSAIREVALAQLLDAKTQTIGTMIQIIHTFPCTSAFPLRTPSHPMYSMPMDRKNSSASGASRHADTSSHFPATHSLSRRG